MIQYQDEYDKFGGEMLPFERRLLFKYIIQAKPNIVFELGSGSGGSTRIILSALNALDKGLLYNCDPHNIAATHIKDVDTSRMKFYQTCSDEMCGNLVRSRIIPQFIFFDGPEDPDCAATDFRYLDAVLPAGVIMVMHDWEIRPRIDGNTSIKAVGMRRELDFQIKLKTWEIVEELSGVWGEYPNIDGYNSIGMVCARKIA